MSNKLENVIRRWGQRGEALPHAPSEPTDLCLTFREAEQIARGERPVQPDRLEHARTCQYCQRLVADFREALVEGAAANPVQVSKKRKFFRFPQIAALAAAASVLIAVGIGIFFSIPRQPRLPILISAEVNSQEQIRTGLTPKGPQQFTSGEIIMFQVILNRDAYLMLINLDPLGRVIALPPKSSSVALSPLISKGIARLWPYRLDNTTGQETFFIVAIEQEPRGIQAKIKRLQRLYDRTGDADTLAEQIRLWPAEVKVISFEHLPPE